MANAVMKIIKSQYGLLVMKKIVMILERATNRRIRLKQSFTRFCSKNFTHFTNLNSLGIENDMSPQHRQKPFWLYKLSVNIFLFGFRKNICTASFLDAYEPHSWSTLKANVCIFLYISLRRFLFQRRSKVLSGKLWDGEGGGWIISLRRLAVWA